LPERRSELLYQEAFQRQSLEIAINFAGGGLSQMYKSSYGPFLFLGIV
jgi:hypothetical protein